MSDTTETGEATATPQRAPKRPENPFAVRIRETSNQIARLLQRYEEFKTGWTQWRIQYQDPKGNTGQTATTFRNPEQASQFLEKQIKPKAPPDYTFEIITEQMDPQISMSSDPESLLQTLNIQEPQDNADSAENSPQQVTNPLLNAMIRIGELQYKDAIVQETVTKIGIIRALGVDATLECSCLIKWARSLAAAFTYLLECKTTYSEEMKSKYAELLADLNNARGIADRLIRTLSTSRGYLGIHEYHNQVGELLRLATIVRKSSLQLADYHDEFMAGKGGGSTPVELGAESVTWVLEGDEEKTRRPPKPEEETLSEEGGKA